MDFHQTTDKYRRREAKSQMKFILWVISALTMLWVGWMIGQNQQWSVVSTSNERLQDMTQRNDQLEYMLAAMTEQLKDERKRRITAETLVNEEDQELLSIRKIVARYLANDVPSEQIRQTLNQIGKPSKCRTLDNRDIEVVTPSFAGGESNRLFLSDTLSIFVEGEVGVDEGRENPWFDPAQPVIVRASFLGGEKNATGLLPLSMVLSLEDWFIRVRLTSTDLKGYVNVTISKCLVN